MVFRGEIMLNKLGLAIKLVLIQIVVWCQPVLSAEYYFKNIFDTGFNKLYNNAGVDIDSFHQGDYGKHANDTNSSHLIAQLSSLLKVETDYNWDILLSTMSTFDSNKASMGLSEAFLVYRSPPDASSYRWQAKVGYMYPKISMENVSLNWNSPYTFSNSVINTWIAEEVKHVGAEFKLSHLSGEVGLKDKLSVALAIFSHNDTAGALLAWHGWTHSYRQSIITDSFDIPNIIARREGNPLFNQAPSSTPFKEIDNRFGAHLYSEWNSQNRFKLNVGYYNNNGIPYIIKDGEYAWKTEFYHLGLNWRINNRTSVISQFLQGDTLMQTAGMYDVVNNSYNAASIMLTNSWDQHRLSFRLENFQVKDRDNTEFDNNNEKGDSLTINYQYKISRKLSLFIESNIIKSNRDSRHYHQLPQKLTEHSNTLGLRIFF